MINKDASANRAFLSLERLHVATILVTTFGTLCVLGEENVIQVDPPPPLNSVACYKSNTFYISYKLYGPQLCLGGGGVGEKSC